MMKVAKFGLSINIFSPNKNAYDKKAGDSLGKNPSVHQTPKPITSMAGKR